MTGYVYVFACVCGWVGGSGQLGEKDGAVGHGEK